jgi:hypothetical protein
MVTGWPLTISQSFHISGARPELRLGNGHRVAAHHFSDGPRRLLQRASGAEGERQPAAGLRESGTVRSDVERERQTEAGLRESGTVRSDVERERQPEAGLRAMGYL